MSNERGTVHPSACLCSVCYASEHPPVDPLRDAAWRLYWSVWDGANRFYPDPTLLRMLRKELDRASDTDTPRTVLYTVPRATVGPLTLDRLEEMDLEGTGRPAADEPNDVGHWVARGLIS